MAHKANSEYKPAIYARLSKEDSRNDVSLSIENQISILEKYCEDNDFAKPQVFYDDDRTGTNFNREGFQKLYAEAKAGNIDVIIVKHTDRFGRNASQAGTYCDAIQDMQIRFISVLQYIDTIDPDSPAVEMLPLLFWVDEMQSRTTSKKVRASNHKMALDGKHRAPYAPYGFQKDPDNKHKIVIDPYSSAVVKRIYEMRLQKYSYGAIINTLNAEGILSPSAYCQEVNGKSTNVKSRGGKWSKDGLNHMFQNVAYRGDTANGMKKVISFKNQKQVRQPMEDWIIKENTHDAIISREDWQKCFDMIETLGRVRRTKESEMLTFTGLLECPDCFSAMLHNHSYHTLKSGEKKRYDYYNCGSYSSQGKSACSSHNISDKELHEIVCEHIRKVAGHVSQDENAMRELFYQIKSSKQQTQINTDKATLEKVNKQLAKLDKLIEAAFEKSVEDDSLSDTFKGLAKKYGTEKKELTEKAAQLNALVQKQSKVENDVETFISLMKKYVNVADMDRETAVELIDHITISEKTDTQREIVIYYNHVGNVG